VFKHTRGARIFLELTVRSSRDAANADAIALELAVWTGEKAEGSYLRLDKLRHRLPAERVLRRRQQARMRLHERHVLRGFSQGRSVDVVVEGEGSMTTLYFAHDEL
jgi:hypothetical protein